jgi:hypothetical protein
VEDLVGRATAQAKIRGPSPFSNYAYAVRLLINPSSLNINMTKIIIRGQTMTGWVEEHWGEELDTISFQGLSAAFVSGGSYTTYDAGRMNPMLQAGNQPRMGLTTKHREDSLSYKNMKELVKIFSTNGLVYDSDGFVAKRYYIQITYDYGCYRGYFESFDITEEASNPFRFNYTVTFKAERTVYKIGAQDLSYGIPEQIYADSTAGTYGELTSALMRPAAITAGNTEPLHMPALPPDVG